MSNFSQPRAHMDGSNPLFQSQTHASVRCYMQSAPHSHRVSITGSSALPVQSSSPIAELDITQERTSHIRLSKRSTDNSRLPPNSNDGGVRSNSEEITKEKASVILVNEGAHRGPSCFPYKQVDISKMSIVENPLQKQGRHTVISGRLADDNPFQQAVERLGRHFVSRKMTRKRVSVTGCEKKDFLSDLSAFNEEIGIKPPRVPVVGRRVVDLYQLIKEVMQLGGAKNVVDLRAFQIVAQRLEIPPTCTSAASVLKRAYEKFLFHYEQKLVFGIDPIHPNPAVDIKELVNKERMANKTTRRKPFPTRSSREKAEAKGAERAVSENNQFDGTPGKIYSPATTFKRTYEETFWRLDALEISGSPAIGQDCGTPCEPNPILQEHEPLKRLSEQLLSHHIPTFTAALRKLSEILLTKSQPLYSLFPSFVQLITGYYAKLYASSSSQMIRNQHTKNLHVTSMTDSHNEAQEWSDTAESLYPTETNLAARRMLLATVALSLMAASNPEDQNLLCIHNELMPILCQVLMCKDTQPSIRLAVLEFLTITRTQHSAKLHLESTPSASVIIPALTKLLVEVPPQEMPHDYILRLLHVLLQASPPETFPEAIAPLTQYLLDNLLSNPLNMKLIQQLASLGTATRQQMLTIPTLVDKLMWMLSRGSVAAATVVRELSRQIDSPDIVGRFAAALVGEVGAV